jgi:hypothetical protein
VLVGRMGRVSGDQEATSSKAGGRPSIDAKYGKPGRIEKSSLRAPEGEQLLFKPSSPTFAEPRESPRSRKQRLADRCRQFLTTRMLLGLFERQLSASTSALLTPSLITNENPVLITNFFFHFLAD